MTAERTRSSILAARFARAMPKTSPLFKSEGAGKTGCPLAPVGSRAKKLREEREDHRWRRRTLRPSLREWFYGLYVISSVSQCSFATVALRRPLEPTQNLTPASGRQDHTTSPSAFAPLVSQRIHVHRIPPHVRDVRDRPSSIEAGWRDHSIDLRFRKTELFLRRGD